MKKYFIVSLVKNGVLGGGINLTDTSITYHTGKVTVPSYIRNLEMKYENILYVEKGWFLFFPTVTVYLVNNESYKFIVFGRKKFISLLNEFGVNLKEKGE